MLLTTSLHAWGRYFTVSFSSAQLEDEVEEDDVEDDFDDEEEPDDDPEEPAPTAVSVVVNEVVGEAELGELGPQSPISRLGFHRHLPDT